jgi:hypothetical protein
LISFWLPKFEKLFYYKIVYKLDDASHLFI